MNFSDTLQTVVKNLLDESTDLLDKEYFGRGLKLVRISTDLYRDDFSDLTENQVKELENGCVDPAHLRLYFKRIVSAFENEGRDDGSDERRSPEC